MIDNRDLPVLEFEMPHPQPWLLGLNPKVAGYRGRAAAVSRWLSIGCAAAAILTVGLAWTEMLSVTAGAVLCSVCVLALAATAWCWRRMEFCSVCGACTKGAFTKTGVAWCPACQNLHNPTQIGIDGSRVLDLSNPAHLWEQEPVPKFLALTVLLGIMDNGHEVSFERVGDSYKVSIAIDHEVHEVVPPPVHIHFGVAQTAKALAGLDLADCTETQEGHIDVKTRDRTVRAKVSVEPVQCGQKVVFRW